MRPNKKSQVFGKFKSFVSISFGIYRIDLKKNCRTPVNWSKYKLAGTATLEQQNRPGSAKINPLKRLNFPIRTKFKQCQWTIQARVLTCSQFPCCRGNRLSIHAGLPIIQKTAKNRAKQLTPVIPLLFYRWFQLSTGNIVWCIKIPLILLLCGNAVAGWLTLWAKSTIS